MTETGDPVQIKPVLGNFSSRTQTRSGDYLKRLIDGLVSGLLLLFLSPLFLYLAWRIKRDSPGPVFYRGLRTGKAGKEFNILKLRTMYEIPESYQGTQITAQDDPRITRVGRRLRDTKLNELPQLWNVFKGEMSLVGPRPEVPLIVEDWPEDARNEILSVRPGITSPASVLYYDEENRLSFGQVMQIYLDDVLPSKLRLDQLYIRYRSFLGDLDILFYTLLVLLPRFNKSSPPEENLLVGAYQRKDRLAVKEDLGMVYQYFPRLKTLRRNTAGYLSGGEQQMLVVGRAIMANPKLLMLDEPSLGLAPMLVKEIYDIIRQFNADHKTSILLVEQNVRVALGIAHYGYVMENGRIVLNGSANFLKNNDDVREFYMGLSATGIKKSYREVKHYKRRKRWL